MGPRAGDHARSVRRRGACEPGGASLRHRRRVLGGQVCRQGVCRTSCTDDGVCDASQHESCVVGQCMPVFAVPYPVDYGVADGNKQPGCSSDDDCVPNIACVGGVCQLSDTCVDRGIEPRNEACPPFGGYTCNASSTHCEGPPCSVAADCTTAANYPIAGLHCLSGRCTSACNSAADCCSGAGVRCPSARAQNQCFQVDTSNPGVCVRQMGTGRLIVYQVASADPRPPIRNIVLVSEGFKLNGGDRTELDHFVNQALKHIQWQTTRADMLAALLSPSLFNIFILELPDQFTGLGQPTLFGHYALNADATTWEYPGSDEQVRFMTRQALQTFEQQVTPALTPPPTVNDLITVFHVVLFNGNTDKRAHSNLGDMIFELVSNDDGPGFSNDRFLQYFVLQHELGHSLGQVDDEYDNDAESGKPPACSLNTVARTTVTNPPCDSCTTSAFEPDNATWGEFVNTSTFPTTTSSFATVGLYSGAEERFPIKSMRSQADCTMREDGRHDYCTACREALMHNVIGNKASQTFRYLDFPNANLVPDQFGLGPNLGVAVDTSRHHAYFTREISTTGIGFSDVDGNVLTRDGIIDLDITGALGGADTPRVISPFGRFVILEGINATDATQSKLLVYDANAQNLASPIALPGLLGIPTSVSGSGALGSFTVYRRDPASGQNQMAFVDISATGPGAPSFSVPTDRAGGMPRLEQAPVLAPTANLLFFPATKVIPAETFCDFDQCQIWAFDPGTGRFVDPIISVSTPGVSEAGIVALTVGQHPTGMPGSLPGELLIAVTDNRVLVWQTAQLTGGNTVPAVNFAHSSGHHEPGDRRGLRPSNGADRAHQPGRRRRDLWRPRRERTRRRSPHHPGPWHGRADPRPGGQPRRRRLSRGRRFLGPADGAAGRPRSHRQPHRRRARRVHPARERDRPRASRTRGRRRAQRRLLERGGRDR